MHVPRETPDIETSSDAYAGRFAGPVGRWLLAAQERAVLTLLERVPGRRVLDVGGGHGQLVGPLLARGYDVTVFGSDPACAARLGRHLAGPRCRFESGDILSLPYRERAFDVVLSVRLLPHVVRWPALVAELCRVADRTVVVDFPTAQSANVLTPTLFGVKRRLEGNTRPYTLFREAEVAETFAAAGFGATGRVPQFTIPMVLHRTLHAPAISAAAEAVCRGIGLTARYGSPVVVRMERMER